MTDGEKMVWAAAYVAAFNPVCPRECGISESAWRTHADRVQGAIVAAIERATLTVAALRAVTTLSLSQECCEDAMPMVAAMLDCDT